MTFPIVGSPGYSDGQKLPAADANLLALYLSRALDALNGGDYSLAPGALLRFLGGGGAIELDAATTFGSGTWPLLSSRTKTKIEPLQIICQTGTSPCTIASDGSGNPVVQMPNCSSSAAAGVIWLALRPPCDGAVLTEVTIGSKGAGAAPVPAGPSYTIISFEPGASTVTALSSTVVDATTWGISGGTAINCTSPVTVDTTTLYYALKITNPFNTGTFSSVQYSNLRSYWTLTSLRSQ